MKKLSFFLLLLIIVLLAIIFHVSYQKKFKIFYVYDDSRKPSVVPALMWYVLTWPPTFCMNLKPPAKCIEPIRQREFTLHGLWPAGKDGKTISCKIDAEQDWDKLFRPIKDELETFWPTLKEGQAQYSIWQHEWRKHGVCGKTTAKEYFDAAIRTNDMFVKGNLFDYLKESNIIPSDSLAYTQEDIVKAIQNVFIQSLSPSPSPSPLALPRSRPIQKVFDESTTLIRYSLFAPAPAPPSLDIYLRCKDIDVKNTTHGYLDEVILCTTMDGSKFVTCPPGGRPKNCDKFKKIVLPPAPQSLAPSPSLPTQPPRFQGETYGTYPSFKQSWAKYIEWLTSMFVLE